VLGVEQGDGEMFARATFGEAPPERVDEMIHEVMEHVLPAVRMQDGFKGGMILVERESGKVLTVSLWESEQAMDATEEAAHWFRVFSAEAAAGRLETVVEKYEVVLSEVKGAQPPTGIM
jgi:heme-degrading monooxygenase HmoA